MRGTSARRKRKWITVRRILSPPLASNKYAGWRMRGLAEAGGGIRFWLDRLTQFIGLIGLWATILLLRAEPVPGIGAPSQAAEHPT